MRFAILAAFAGAMLAGGMTVGAPSARAQGIATLLSRDFHNRAIKAIDDQIRQLEAGGIPFETTMAGGRKVTVVLSRDEFIDGLTISAFAGEISPNDIAAIVRAAEAKRRNELDRLREQRSEVLREGQRLLGPPPPVYTQPRVYPRTPPTITQPRVYPRTPPTIAQPQVGSAWMVGRFRSTFGTMTFGPSGGTYESPEGSILQVQSIKGTVVEGIWLQQHSAKLCPGGGYQGRFHFEFNSNGFTGSWGYCNSNSDGGGWSGTRIN